MFSKINYYFKRLFKMNYKNFFQTVNICSEVSCKSKIFIFMDILFCSIRYGAGHLDYKNFKMYKLNKNDRKKILTVGKNSHLVRTLNNKKSREIFENKNMFYEKFNKYINRKYIKLGDNLNEFKKFISNKEYIIIKPLDGMCGKGVEKIKVGSKDSEQLYYELITKGQTLVEEVATQCSEMSKLHEKSINTVRIVSLVNKNNKFSIVGSYVRIGNGGVIDNFNGGGVACPIDIKTGVITHDAVNKKGEYFKIHPISNVKFVGYQIPKWDKVIKLIEEVSKVVDDVRFVGWDVCIGEDGPFLIEANSFPGQDLYQIPSENIGTYNVILEALKK